MCRMDDCADFDLLINTDAIDPLEKAGDIIITALRVNGRIDKTGAR